MLSKLIKTVARFTDRHLEVELSREQRDLLREKFASILDEYNNESDHDDDGGFINDEASESDSDSDSDSDSESDSDEEDSQEAISIDSSSDEEEQPVAMMTRTIILDDSSDDDSNTRRVRRRLQRPSRVVIEDDE